MRVDSGAVLVKFGLLVAMWGCGGGAKAVVVPTVVPKQAGPVVTRLDCPADEPGALRTSWHGCEGEPEACQQACDGGDADACLTRAYAVERERGEPSQLFERACRGGIAIACTNWAAGVFADDGPRNGACTSRMFAKACAAKDLMGCTMVARDQIEHGRTPEEIETGAATLEDLCTQQGGMICRILASYVERGDLGMADPVRAKRLRERACATGDEDACASR